MINNYEQIKPLLKFENEGDFYFVQIIQRKKDKKEIDVELKGSDNSSRLIKAYYIYSIEQFDKQIGEMIILADLFKARIGINLNKRNSKDISLEMLALLAHNIKSNHTSTLHRLYNTICGQHHSEKDKTWILDVDHKNMREINDMINVVDRACLPNGNKFISLIPSKSGFHVITKAFDTREFSKLYPNVEIHKNNPTNLYIPK